MKSFQLVGSWGVCSSNNRIAVLTDPYNQSLVLSYFETVPLTASILVGYSTNGEVVQESFYVKAYVAGELKHHGSPALVDDGVSAVVAIVSNKQLISNTK